MYLQFTGTDVRLLGSMHLFPAASPDLPAWVSQAYEWSEALIFESDAPTILPFLKGQGEAPLERLLSPGAWNELQAVWPPSGPLAPLGELHPWSALIVAPTLYQRVAEGVEPRMIGAAIAHSKPYRYLETAQEVAASLQSIPLEAVTAALELLVSDRSEPQRTLDLMHAAWLKRDLRTVHRIAAASPMFSLPGIRQAILDARNRAWAPRVAEAFASRQRTLVVVGALHLCGAENLVECLGRPVEPIPVDG